MDTRTLRVAAMQCPVTPHLATNRDRILGAIGSAAAEGIELLVFPETALTGYSPTIGHGRAAEEWPAIAQCLGDIARAAGAAGVSTVVGSEAWTGDAWVNRLYAFSARGEQVAVYDKYHLTGADTQYYWPGSELGTCFELNGIRIGLQICYDARFPEGCRALLAQGAEVIAQAFHGAGSDTWKVPVLAAHLRSRAAENGCFLVAANTAGPLQIVVSQIVDPLGLVLAEANQDREELISATLHLQRIGASEIRRDYATRFSPSR